MDKVFVVFAHNELGQRSQIVGIYTDNYSATLRLDEFRSGFITPFSTDTDISLNTDIDAPINE